MAPKVYKGQFKISQWDENALYEDEGGAKQSRASIKQEYSGDLTGTSNVEYIMQYQSAMSAEFVGYEEISAKINGKSVCFVLRHIGTFKAGVAKSEFNLVSQERGSKYTSVSGSGSFEAGAGGIADYEFILTFE